MDQLKNYYKQEREEYEERMRSLEKTHARAIDTLEEEILLLKKEIDKSYQQHNEQLKSVNNENSGKLKQILEEKDNLIAELRSKVI